MSKIETDECLDNTINIHCILRWVTDAILASTVIRGYEIQRITKILNKVTDYMVNSSQIIPVSSLDEVEENAIILTFIKPQKHSSKERPKPILGRVKFETRRNKKHYYIVIEENPEKSEELIHDEIVLGIYKLVREG